MVNGVVLKPVWTFKVRRAKSVKGNVERVVKIPNEIAEQLGDYVKMTLEDGKLVIEPLQEG